MSQYIVLDARKIKDNTGIAAYIKALLLVYDSYVLLWPQGVDVPSQYLRHKIICVRSKPFSLWEHFEIPFKLIGIKIAAFHAPHFNIALGLFMLRFFKKFKLVTTIHDIIPIKHAKLNKSPLKSSIQKLLISIAVKWSDHILTVSAYSRNEIQAYFKVPIEKISVIYNCIQFNTPPITREIVLTHRPKLLFVGSLFEHKNILSLVAAIPILQEQGIYPTLNLVGPTTPYARGILNKIQELKLDHCIFCLGTVSNDELVKQYRSSDIFVFPSLEEGFGIPLIEAMYYGLPIISSNRSVMPEIIGNAGKLIDPTPQEFCQTISDLINMPDDIKQLIQNGHDRWPVFSLDVFKEKVHAYYAKLN